MKSTQSIWIALAGARPVCSDSPIVTRQGAYFNVASLASTENAFLKQIGEVCASLGLELTEIEDLEEFVGEDYTKLGGERLELVRLAILNGGPALGNFFTYDYDDS